MNAEPLIRTRIVICDNAFAELVLWKLPTSARGSSHNYKYRLALVEDNVCTVRYDNEAGKGDHRHVGNKEEDYRFVSVERLMADFMDEIEKRMRKR